MPPTFREIHVNSFKVLIYESINSTRSTKPFPWTHFKMHTLNSLSPALLKDRACSPSMCPSLQNQAFTELLSKMEWEAAFGLQSKALTDKASLEQPFQDYSTQCCSKREQPTKSNTEITDVKVATWGKYRKWGKLEETNPSISSHQEKEKKKPHKKKKTRPKKPKTQTLEDEQTPKKGKLKDAWPFISLY